MHVRTSVSCEIFVFAVVSWVNAIVTIVLLMKFISIWNSLMMFGLINVKTKAEGGFIKLCIAGVVGCASFVSLTVAT